MLPQSQWKLTCRLLSMKQGACGSDGMQAALAKQQAKAFLRQLSLDHLAAQSCHRHNNDMQSELQCANRQSFGAMAQCKPHNFLMESGQLRWLSQ